MSPLLSTLTLWLASSGVPATNPTYTGRWSPYSLLILVIMCFISLCLLVVFLALLMMGRFRSTLPEADDFDAEPPPEDWDEDAAPPMEEAEDTAAAMMEADLYEALEGYGDLEDLDEYEDVEELEELELLPGEADAPPSEPKESLASRLMERFAAGQATRANAPRRKTGLWQCVAAFGLAIVATLCWLGLENIYGPMAAFTDCSLLLLLLLGLQITFCVQLWLRQRKL